MNAAPFTRVSPAGSQTTPVTATATTTNTTTHEDNWQLWDYDK